LRTRQNVRPSTFEKPNAVLLCIVAWFVPGAGHLWLQRTRNGLILFTALSLMFAIGLVLGGRIFPFEPSQPLVALASIADMGIGVAYVIARLAEWGFGRVAISTYEYGNTFLITSGLLNFLVMIDVYDIAMGRK